MTIRRLAVAGLALLLPFAAAACGGSDDTNSGPRPSTSELSAAFKKVIPAGVPSATAGKYADCVAQKLEDSDLPNGVLRSLAKGEEKTYVDSDNKDKYEKIVTDASQACVKEVIGG